MQLLPFFPFFLLPFELDRNRAPVHRPSPPALPPLISFPPPLAERRHSKVKLRIKASRATPPLPLPFFSFHPKLESRRQQSRSPHPLAFPFFPLISIRSSENERNAPSPPPPPLLSLYFLLRARPPLLFFPDRKQARAQSHLPSLPPPPPLFFFFPSFPLVQSVAGKDMKIRTFLSLFFPPFFKNKKRRNPSSFPPFPLFFFYRDCWMKRSGVSAADAPSFFSPSP